MNAEGQDPPKLVPRKLEWGFTAINATGQVQSALDSPVIHAWIVQQKDLPVEIRLIGEGLGELGEAIRAAALRAALSIPRAEPRAQPLHLFARGAIVLRVGDSGKMARSFPPLLALDTPEFEVPPMSKHGEVLRRFAQLLRRLEKETGMVEVHELAENEDKGIARNLRERANAADSGSVHVLRPPTDAREHLLLLPSYRIGKPGQRYATFQTLAKDKDFCALFSDLYVGGFSEMGSQLAVRWDLYAEDEKHHLTRLKEFDDAKAEAERTGENPAERIKVLFGEFVYLQLKFDPETGRTVFDPAAPPVPIMEHYGKLPKLIADFRIWRKAMETYIVNLCAAYYVGFQDHPDGITAKMKTDEVITKLDAHIISFGKALHDTLDVATQAPQLPAAFGSEMGQLLIGELVDAMIREKPLEDLAVRRRQALERCSRLVRQLLVAEFAAKPDAAANREPLFQRQSIFQCHYNPDSESISVVPLTVFDRRRSVLILDGPKGCLRSECPYEWATAIDPAHADSDRASEPLHVDQIPVVFATRPTLAIKGLLNHYDIDLENPLPSQPPSDPSRPGRSLFPLRILADQARAAERLDCYWTARAILDSALDREIEEPSTRAALHVLKAFVVFQQTAYRDRFSSQTLSFDTASDTEQAGQNSLGRDFLDVCEGRRNNPEVISEIHRARQLDDPTVEAVLKTLEDTKSKDPSSNLMNRLSQLLAKAREKRTIEKTMDVTIQRNQAGEATRLADHLQEVLQGFRKRKSMSITDAILELGPLLEALIFPHWLEGGYDTLAGMTPILRGRSFARPGRSGSETKLE